MHVEGAHHQTADDDDDDSNSNNNNNNDNFDNPFLLSVSVYFTRCKWG